MINYRDQLAAAVRAVTIRSPTEYAWLGHAGRALPRSVREQLSAGECRRHLVASVREVLYASFYTSGVPVPVRWNGAHSVAADPGLTTALSDANVGVGSWDSAWIVDSCNNGAVVVSTPRLRVRVSASDCRPRDGGQIRSGAAVSVPLPKELPALSPCACIGT
jgi:hypothetical protein